ncbi:hypothetical protein M673_20605 (plasmid) [Aureimonas sp. AU20]|nr:hypothetical protein M673_20605 [Aureimonas sp. AU20]
MDATSSPIAPTTIGLMEGATIWIIVTVHHLMMGRLEVLRLGC